MATNVKISVMMCVYNRSVFLPEAIESVLIQDFKDFELLILDDASTEDVKSLIPADPRVRYIRNEKNLGITKNRNKGLAEAHGEFIAILDSDDQWTNRDKLSQQYIYLLDHPEIVAVGTWAEIVNAEGNPQGDISYPEDPKHIRTNMLVRNPIVNSSVLFRKQAAIDAGGYDESLRIYEDYALWLALDAKKGTKTHPALANIPQKMIAYRKHANQSDSQIRIQATWTNLCLVWKYRNAYPRRIRALIKGLVRIVVATFW